jgi:ankyrin repeat protein
LCYLLSVVFGILVGCHSRTSTHYADRPELTPLMNAAANNDLVRVRRLIEQGADVHQRTKEGETALYEAIERRDLNKDNLPVVDALLKAGADPNELEFTATSPLVVSLTRDYGNADVTLLLLRAGARVPQICDDDDSVLSLATMDSSLEVMHALLARKAPVNCQDKTGATALYWAALNGQADRVALLLQYGAYPHLTDKQGKTPLDYATTTNPERRVQDDFAKTRGLLGGAKQLKKR